MNKLNQSIVLNEKNTPYMMECQKRDAKLFDDICNKFRERQNASST